MVAPGVVLGRRRDLDEHQLGGPLRVGLEELLEREQLVRDALDVVHPVVAEEQLLAVEAALQLDDLVLELRGVEHLLELGAIDSAGEGVDGHRGLVRRVEDVLGLDADVGAEHARGRVHEVAHVVIDLEADQVRREHAAQDLLAQGERLVDLGRGEGRVQEPADLRLGVCVAQQGGQEHQVVVVHEDDVALLPHLGDGGGEGLVEVRVVLPPLVDHVRVALEHGERDVVEERPDDLRAQHLCALGLFGREEHGDAAARVEHVARVLDLLGCDVLGGAAHPRHVEAVEHRLVRRHLGGARRCHHVVQLQPALGVALQAEG
mmetsp:Transcript_12566/g.31311  ORF Transcript_12566/g.31311 Transcript_12566/m.31311 type:complete len:319 (-) Transcript_12566:689-1645(-)